MTNRVNLMFYKSLLFSVLLLFSLPSLGMKRLIHCNSLQTNNFPITEIQIKIIHDIMAELEFYLEGVEGPILLKSIPHHFEIQNEKNIIFILSPSGDGLELNFEYMDAFLYLSPKLLRRHFNVSDSMKEWIWRSGVNKIPFHCRE